MYAKVISGIAAPTLLVLGLAACGSDDKTGTPAAAAPTTTATAAPSATPAPSSSAPAATGTPSPTAPAFDLCAVLPKVYVDGVFSAKVGRYEMVDGACVVYTKTNRAKLIVHLLAGSQATAASSAQEWQAPLRPIGDDNWAAGVKPASDGNGILLMNKTSSHACTARTSDTNGEVRSADKMEYYHILAALCYEVLR